jgi:DNA-binding MarR family transcriptional regulator
VSTNPLGAQLLTVIARLNRWATREADLEVLPAQARLLAQLDELGPARIGDLARADHSSQPTMTGQVQRLEACGLATRRQDPEDARASLVELTEGGRAALERVRAARSAVLAPLIDRLDPVDRRALRTAITSLGRLLEAADRPERAADPTHHRQPAQPSQES